MRRLTDKELQDKKAKGICFRCDDKWSMGHRCRKRELSVLLIDDENVDDNEEEIEDDNSASQSEGVTAEVSLNSVFGISNPKTMKLSGRIEGKEVVVMIDPGATHNFISLKTVEDVGIKVLKSDGFGVSLENGDSIHGTGICKEVRLNIGGLSILEKKLPLQLGNSDVILGIEWLEKLGPVVSNWKTQEMKFTCDGVMVVLIGDPSLVRSKISLKAMLRTIRKTGGGIRVELSHLATSNEQQKSKSDEVVPKYLTGDSNDISKFLNYHRDYPRLGDMNTQLCFVTTAV